MGPSAPLAISPTRIRFKGNVAAGDPRPVGRIFGKLGFRWHYHYFRGQLTGCLGARGIADTHSKQTQACNRRDSDSCRSKRPLAKYSRLAPSFDAGHLLEGKSDIGEHAGDASH